MHDPIYAGTTVAQLFEIRSDAERAAAALRSGGFSNVRIHGGAADPVTLTRLGFSRPDAEMIAAALARGETLLSVIASGAETSAVVTAMRLQNAELIEPARDTHRIALHAERLQAAKVRETSEARIHKEVVVEEQVVRIPIRREELVVEREGEAPVRIPMKDENPQPKPES